MPLYTEDEKYMHRCLDLALLGKGSVAPNPMVGAVLVNNNSIIGEGFHQLYGEAHAEVNAIRHVERPELLKKASLYVNLEPCTHYGKTPPCAELIIEKNIPKVIIGTSDPNKLVAGNGMNLLRANGVEVVCGVLENECKAINKRFFTWHLHKRPYIILKWARSADGFIDLDRPANAPVGPNWITSPTARILVHKWRSEEQAILAGTNTIMKDNPRLNIRDWSGKDPLRVIIDRNLKVGSHHHIFDNTQETLIFTEKLPSDEGQTAGFKTEELTSQEMKTSWNEMVSANTKSKTADLKDKAFVPERNKICPGKIKTSGKRETTIQIKTRYAKITFDNTAELKMLEFLYNQNIQSLIIEGGAFTLNRFIEKGLWDEARIFTGPSLFKGGVKSPEITGKSQKSQIIGNSQLQTIYKG